MTAPLQSFVSDRHFQLWRYTVEHSQLLLRSPCDNTLPTRVEVLFQGVDHVDLPTSFNELHVRKDGARFIAYGPGWRGSVTAVVMFATEDERQDFEPSTLFIDAP